MLTSEYCPYCGTVVRSDEPACSLCALRRSEDGKLAGGWPEDDGPGRNYLPTDAYEAERRLAISQGAGENVARWRGWMAQRGRFR